MSEIIVSKTTKAVELTVNRADKIAEINRIYETGKSAYDLSVEYGYTGTEAEWVALQNSLTTEAAAYANQAMGYRDSALTYSTNAYNSSVSAASSATLASGYSTSASASATNASASASTATTQATNASNSATAAATSATAAANSATTAATTLASKFNIPTGLTSGTLPKWNGTGFSNSLFSDNGTLATIAGDVSVNGVRVGRGGGNNTSNLVVGNGSFTQNATGIYNIAIGYESLLNSTGNSNVSIGYTALKEITTGGSNIAIGSVAGRYISDGLTPNTNSNNSIFIGQSARPGGDGQSNQIVIGNSISGLGSNTNVFGNPSTTFGRWYGNLLLGSNTNSGEMLQVNGTSKLAGNVAVTGNLTTTGTINFLTVGTGAGNFNCVVGNGAFSTNVSGSDNTAIGSFALQNNLAVGNTSIGRSSLSNISTGAGNIAVGFNAGRFISGASVINTTSSYSIFLGMNSYPLGDNQTNQIVIAGSNGVGLGSSTTVLGNSSTTQSHLYGTLTIGTGTTPSSSAIADFQSTTKGFLPPRGTTAQRTAISSPSEGLCFYDTTLHKLYVYDGSTWQAAW